MTGSAVLRSAVGEENFPDLEAICARLDQLGCRLAVSSEGLDRIMATIAEELVAQRLALDAAGDALGLPGAACPGDTPTPEDPTS